MDAHSEWWLYCQPASQVRPVYWRVGGGGGGGWFDAPGWGGGGVKGGGGGPPAGRGPLWLVETNLNPQKFLFFYQIRPPPQLPEVQFVGSKQGLFGFVSFYFLIQPPPPPLCEPWLRASNFPGIRHKAEWGGGSRSDCPTWVRPSTPTSPKALRDLLAWRARTTVNTRLR